MPGFHLIIDIIVGVKSAAYIVITHDEKILVINILSRVEITKHFTATSFGFTKNVMSEHVAGNKF